MTEAEWNACTDPRPMLEFVRGEASDRKLRLFAVACCRKAWDLLTDPRSRYAVEVAEAFADGKVFRTKLRAAYTDAERARKDFPLGTFEVEYPFLLAASCAWGTTFPDAFEVVH